jgi:hypothetical protein
MKVGNSTDYKQAVRYWKYLTAVDLMLLPDSDALQRIIGIHCSRPLNDERREVPEL